MIACENLTHYYGSKLALDNVSFKIESNRPVALVGPNGAGKTTLFSILCGYLKASSGEATILGHKAGSDSLIGHVSALPQDALLDPNTTISSQLNLFARLQGFDKLEASEESNRILDLVNLADQHSKKPGELSHGMRKRVAIAQALIGQPKFVLLDEPTAGLDPQNAMVIRQIIESCQHQTQFLISSHNLEELERLCDDVLYLDNGKLQQTVNIQNRTELQVLQLKVIKGTADISELLSNISGVNSVNNPRANEYQIHYDRDNFAAVDQDVLKSLAQKQIEYINLQKGKSLEQQLFDT